MKKREAVELNRQLSQIQNVRGKVKFAYGVMKNINILKSEMSLLDKATEEYRKERELLVNSHYKHNDKGELVIENNKPVIIDEAKLRKALEEFGEKHKDFLAAYESILDEEIDVTLYKIPIESFEGLYIIQDGKEVPVSFSAFEMKQLEPIIKE